MRYLTAALLALSLLQTAHAAPWRRNRTEYFPYRQVKMENEFLSLVFAPGQLGRLASVRVKRDGTELLEEFKVCRYIETPLFHLDSGNFQGIRELLWRRSLSEVSPMELLPGEKNALVFKNPAYGGSSLGLHRQVTLPPRALAVTFETFLTNNGKQEEKISVWLNLQGALPAKPLIPVLGKGRVPNRGEVDLHKRPFLFTGAPGNSNLPPAAPWGAFVLTGRKTVWAVSCPELLSGGFFYSWGSPEGRLPVRRTVEPVLAEETLAPGARSRPVRFDLLVFPGFEGINGLCGDTAVEIRRIGAGEYAFLVQSARPAPAAEMSLILRGGDGKKLFEQEYALPGRAPGAICCFKARMRGCPVSGSFRVAGNEVPLFFEKERRP